MAQFVDNEWLESMVCGKCGIHWAAPAHFLEERRSDGKTFWCPNGDPRVYRESTEDKLKRELERKQQVIDAANARAATAEREKSTISKAHKRMRIRVMNGVCPCCDRTFQNLMKHMQTQHPDFAKTTKMLQTIRSAFGMTQGDVAKEAHVNTNYVSLYERDKEVPAYAKARLDEWVEFQSAKEKA